MTWRRYTSPACTRDSTQLFESSSIECLQRPCLAWPMIVLSSRRESVPTATRRRTNYASASRLAVNSRTTRGESFSSRPSSRISLDLRGGCPQSMCNARDAGDSVHSTRSGFNRTLSITAKRPKESNGGKSGEAFLVWRILRLRVCLMRFLLYRHTGSLIRMDLALARGGLSGLCTGPPGPIYGLSAEDKKWNAAAVRVTIDSLIFCYTTF